MPVGHYAPRGTVESSRSRIDEVRERFARSGFHSWIGMRLERVEIGEVHVALDVEPRHLNLVGLLHGGLIAALADTATGLAYRTVLEPGTRHVTTHLSVTFLSPGRRRAGHRSGGGGEGGSAVRLRGI
jgi:uncharacterized protein (TIGR00369 family)